MGLGRLVDTEELLGVIKQVLGRGGDLAGRYIVVTAGGTQEPLDPVRHIGNRSSGKMGYAIAEAARDRGAEVILISAPTAIPHPVGVKMVQGQTALQMQQAVAEAIDQADALIMAAAVADYRPLSVVEHKIKKETPTLTLELVRTADILSQVKGDLVKVGFAAESENLVENAKEKLEKKQLHLIVANDIADAESGFGVDTNRVVIIDQQGGVESLPLLPKREVANKLLNRLVELLGGQGRARE
jgi:phosphopantothenoylcysteine decarboxylase/phosphopantothenate--cysteine ligase